MVKGVEYKLNYCHRVFSLNVISYPKSSVLPPEIPVSVSEDNDEILNVYGRSM